MKKIIISICCVVQLTACSSYHAAPVAEGGLIGGAVGAGTGAIIGASIANGDVAASALLGGAIGIPAGLVIGAIYDYNSDQSIKERKRAQISATQDEIFARQREIDALREQIRADSSHGNPSPELREYKYIGPSLGNYYR